MARYEIKIDKKIIAILGPHLYGDTASIIAELIANAYDADADNCWVSIRTGAAPEITIEDNGSGMTPDDVNNYFLDIGFDRREQRPVTKKGRRVFGRKGIGKLAAFSLAKTIRLYSLKDGEKAGCVLDYERITGYGEDPEAIPDEDIVFEPGKLSAEGTGTRLVLGDIRKNINNTYYYLVNRIVRNFSTDFEEFKIQTVKNDEAARTVASLRRSAMSCETTALRRGTK
jgi:HSP90 family molecular chaperone